MREILFGFMWAAQAPMMPLLRAILENHGLPTMRMQLTMTVYGPLVWLGCCLLWGLVIEGVMRLLGA